jgi:hypothetical protein
MTNVKAGPGLVDVMLCCNNRNGITMHHLERVSVLDRINLDGRASFREIEGGFRLAGKTFAYHSYTPHVGNICWNCYWVTPEVAAALLNHLKNQGDWSCDDAEEKFWNRWYKASQRFKAEDFNG